MCVCVCVCVFLGVYFFSKGSGPYDITTPFNAFCDCLVLIALWPDGVFLVLTDPLCLLRERPHYATVAVCWFLHKCVRVCVCVCVFIVCVYCVCDQISNVGVHAEVRCWMQHGAVSRAPCECCPIGWEGWPVAANAVRDAASSWS